MITHPHKLLTLPARRAFRLRVPKSTPSFELAVVSTKTVAFTVVTQIRSSCSGASRVLAEMLGRKPILWALTVGNEL